MIEIKKGKTERDKEYRELTLQERKTKRENTYNKEKNIK